MSTESKPIPDPATTYERAKPRQQSPSGQLTGPAASPQKKADQLQKGNKEPKDSPHSRQGHSE